MAFKFQTIQLCTNFASLYEMLHKSVEVLNFKILFSVIVVTVSICYKIQNYNKIILYFTDIWQCNYFHDGHYLPW